MFACVLAVSLTNSAASADAGSLLLGKWHQIKTGATQQSAPRTAGLDTTNALVPLSAPATAINPEQALKDEQGDVDTQIAPSNVTDQLVSAAAPVSGVQDPAREGDVRLYTVQDGDTLEGIAEDHDISLNTLLWANEIFGANEVAPGDTLFILPVSGTKHVVSASDDLDDIADQYDADRENIIAFNELPANGELTEGQEIIIPGGQEDTTTLQDETGSSFLVRRNYVSGSGAETAFFTGSGGEQRKGGNFFPFGYCTYYVAQKRSISWRGNAGAWLYNAKAQGHKTGKDPEEGAVVVTTDDPYYGHVAYVEKVNDDSIEVSEMNFKAFGRVNKRTIPIDSRTIRGYIY